MFLEVKNFLTPEECQTLINIAEVGTFADGLASNKGATHALKRNVQLTPTQDQLDTLRKTLVAAYSRSDSLKAFAHAKDLRDPTMSRYVPGMYYNRHLDQAIITRGTPMRTDLSLTVFLNSPDTYEGGALQLETDYGVISCRGAAGTAICYATHVWHGVSEVTSGQRLALVTWIQSHVRDPLKRGFLTDLSLAVKELEANQPQADATRRVKRTLTSLTKLWYDM